MSRTRIGRRRLLAGLAAGLVAPWVAPRLWSGRALAETLVRPRVVVVGGGFAGVRFIAALRALTPDVDVVLIEPAADFFSGPSAIDYVFGRIERADAVRDYAALERHGVRLMRGRVMAVDPARRVVETDAGPLAYTILVMATGIEIKPGEIEGLGDDPALNLSLYDRAALDDLRAAIAGFEGGTVIIGVPPGALKCPPAPYEYALMMAESIRSRGLVGEVVLIDAWPSPQPDAIGGALAAAMAAHGDLIDYIGQDRVTGVDVGAKSVLTEGGDEIPFDLLSLIPPNRATSLVKEAGMTAEGDDFAAVDPVTQRSLYHPEVFVIGDLARNPFGKNAAAAAETAVLCAREVARDLGRGDLVPFDAANPARVVTACYPYTDLERALRLKVDFRAHMAGEELVLDSSPDIDNTGSPGNLALRKEWEAALLAEMFE